MCGWVQRPLLTVPGVQMSSSAVLLLVLLCAACYCWHAAQTAHLKPCNRSRGRLALAFLSLVNWTQDS